jgi:hypothetical protein
MAALAVTVVMELAVTVLASALVLIVPGATSKGVVWLTPENAKIAPCMSSASPSPVKVKSVVATSAAVAILYKTAPHHSLSPLPLS